MRRIAPLEDTLGTRSDRARARGRRCGGAGHHFGSGDSCSNNWGRAGSALEEG